MDLNKALKERGTTLNAGFAIKAGRSSLMRLNAFDKIIMKLDRARFALKSGEERLAEIVDIIINRKKHKPETSSWAANIFGSMLHGVGLNSFKTKDSGFAANDECKGCGNCAKVCPRQNISIENNKPVFHNNCELCHACIQWCSNFAIRHSEFDLIPVQYHNPAIKLKQMILR
jgi:ferredoxin